jgi:nitrilase
MGCSQNPHLKGKFVMSNSANADSLVVGIAQMSPVWLNREQTLDKIIEYVDSAGHEGCRMVVFGEALLPGYPFWIELTDGARFNATIQKEIHAHI